MYILVNEDIKIGKGKLAGQVGHAVASYLYNGIVDNMREALEDSESAIGEIAHHDLKEIDEYMKEQKKIILKCPQWKLEELERTNNYITIRDKGYTQLEPNTLTCVNYGICDVTDVPDWIKELKLYS